MPALVDFTTAYDGQAVFFTGTGTTDLVPHVFPVALNGRPYMIDSASNNFTRQYDARVRDSVDQSTEPGENSINPQGLWRRSQSSWHYGAGQIYSDTAEDEPYRFRTSKGVDVWTQGQLSLLKETVQAYSSTESNLFMATAGNRIYGCEGQALRFTMDWTSFTTVTGTPASAIVGIASDGFNVWTSHANGTIYRTDAGSTSSASYVTGILPGTMKYARGRLMVAGRSTDKHKIWNITAGGNNPSALFTHPNTNFEWHGFAAGQNNIYAAGHAGNKSLIYKITIQPDGTSLTVPTVAAELPFGEIVTSIDAYLGFVLIGLENGFRFCSSDGNGNLVVGPLIETGGAVQAFAGIGQYVYFGWTNFDADSTGIGRLDVSTQVSANQPAYASDLMVAGQGVVVDVHEFGGQPVFTVAGLGAYRPGTDLVAEGFLESGIYRWGVPDAKFIPKWDIRTIPLRGTVQVLVSSDKGPFVSIGTQAVADSLDATFDGFESKVFEAEAKLVLTRCPIACERGPQVTRWMARAYAAPLRSQIFNVPLLLHHVLNPKTGGDYWMDVDDELLRLRDLVDNPRVVTYQENTSTYSVVVEDVRWFPMDGYDPNRNWSWDGTCLVVLRSVR